MLRYFDCHYGGSRMLRAVTALATMVLVTVSAMGPFSAVESAVAAEVPTSFYVATDGSDGSLCDAIGAPCLTVSGAVALAQTAITGGAADVTVHVAAGTYNENVVIGAVAPGHSLSL